MKKSILLFSACLMAGLANAQHARRGIMFEPQTSNVLAPAPGQSFKALPGDIQPISLAGHTTDNVLSGARTTASGSGKRWYNYVAHLLQPYQNNLSHDVYYYSASMWNDTSALYGYTGVTSGSWYLHNSLLSIGMGLDPMYSPWNNVLSSSFPDFTGLMAVTNANAYTVDSAFVPGWYRHIYTTAAKTAVVDTLVLTFVEGTGGASSDLPGATQTAGASDYGVTTLSWPDLSRDLVNNRAAHAGGSAVTSTSAVYKIPLTASDSDASTYTTALSTYPRVGHSDPTISFPVPAGHIFAMTATFKSGDTAYHAFPYSDTIRYSNNTAITGYKYSYWTPQVYFTTDDNPGASTSAASFPPFDVSNLACGYFANEGRGWSYGHNKYYPNWDIVASLSPDVAAEAQYPNIAFHLACPTCDTVGTATLAVNNVTDLNNIRAVPNPTNNQLNVLFTQASGETATVTLTNMVGQQVASQSVTNGKAAFNTSALPAGVYIYSVKVNNQSATGRVTVAH